MRSFFLSILFLPVCTIISSCQMIWTPKSPRGYVMPRPERMDIDKKLNEISGLYYLEDDNAFLTIADDKQRIFRLTTDGRVSNYFAAELPRQEDYEDIIMVDSIIYILISNGNLLAVNTTDTATVFTTYPFRLEGTNDFETAYYDPATAGIVILCKKCEHEKKENARTAYRFDLATKTFDSQPFYSIDRKQITDVLKDGVTVFEPSGAAWSPVDKKLYILSSAGNLLVVTNGKDSVFNVYRLNPTLYPQAEGIAFATNGDMYVSNEAKLGKPTLLRISYKTSTGK